MFLIPLAAVHRSLPCTCLLLLGWAVAALPLRAQQFQVFCVANNDGTTTCEGWRGGETLTCVGSRGAVTTCSTPSGRTFTCVLEPGGVTTCADNPTNRVDENGTDCTFTGDGNFVCRPPRPAASPLLPGPRLQQADPMAPAIPAFPTPGSVLTEPSVFGP